MSDVAETVADPAPRPEPRRAQAARSLPTAAIEILESLFQHRLMTSSQLHALHCPQASPKHLNSLVAELHRRGLANSVYTRGRGAEKVWYLTKNGLQTVDASPHKSEHRLRPVTPEQAAGSLQAHALAVNDIGVAFAATARQHGEHHHCTSLSWRDEIVHRIADGRASPQTFLRADALLDYTLEFQDEILFRRWFVELDRATENHDVLALKLRQYARLHAYTAAGESRPAWQDEYLEFPRVLIVIAPGRPTDTRSYLENRLHIVKARAELDPIVRRLAESPDGKTPPPLRAAFCLLEDLLNHGPRALIAQSLCGSGTPTSLLPVEQQS